MYSSMHILNTLLKNNDSSYLWKVTMSLAKLNPLYKISFTLNFMRWYDSLYR